MGTTLTGTEIKDTYDSLIKVTDSGPLSGTAKYLSDGLGNDSVLALSTTALGIGTASPTSLAQLNGTAGTAHLRISEVGATIGFVGGANGIISGVTGQLAVRAEAGLILSSQGNSQTMVLTSAGNVGIGTSAPVSKFHVAGADAWMTLQRTSGTTNILDFTDSAAARIGYVGAISSNISILSTSSVVFNANSAEVMRITASGNVSIGTTYEGGKLTVEQPSAARVTTLVGNNNLQGFAQNHRVVRQYPVVSLGTKLIIPFVGQGSLNSNTFVRIIGHSARYNSGGAQGFAADFTVGHLAIVTALATLSSTGNIASIASSGANVEITFTSNYTSVDADGIFVTIEYMTNNVIYSIDVPNIAMN
jgi:hypothetical protein